MIGRLRGQLAEVGTDYVLIDVAGVGYVVTVSDRLRASLPSLGEAVSLHTDLLVREDLLQLFGFDSVQEREWHRLLMTVQGIGAKASMAILGAIGGDGVGRAIALGDWSAVATAKGVGPKTAQRVVRELKDKAPAVMALGSGLAATAPSAASGVDDVIEPAAPVPQATAPAADTSDAQADALSALANLGYLPGEAAAAVAQAAVDAPDADTSSLIRAALRLMAPKG